MPSQNLRTVFYILIALLGLLSCNSHPRKSETAKRLKDNLAYYKNAAREIALAVKDKKILLYGRQIDSLLRTSDGFKNLRFLVKNDLMTNDKYSVAVFSSDTQSLNFVINESDNYFFAKLTSDRRVHSSELVSFDPEKTWLERKSIIGVTDDVGIDELQMLEENWYYIATWSAD